MLELKRKHKYSPKTGELGKQLGKAESVLRLSSESVLRLCSESVLRLISESVLRLFRVMESMEIGDKRRRTSVLLYLKKRIGHGE